MELSTEILESLVMDNKDVMEVLKDENVTEEDIIFESEVTGEDSEETEIEEIIEIIEEVEEEEGDEAPPDGDVSDKAKSVDAQDTEMVEKTKKNDKNKTTSKNIELYSFDEENSMFSSQFEKEPTKNVKSSTQKTIKKQVINYDVDEDWQDEELERVDGLDNNSELTDSRLSTSRTQSDKKHVNNQTILLQSNRLDLKIHVDSAGRDKSRMDGNKISNIDDGESTQEIVKNTENNLLYTVLGTKKQDTSAKQQQEKLSDHYVKVSMSGQSINIFFKYS